jgi:hypothetical protein
MFLSSCPMALWSFEPAAGDENADDEPAAFGADMTRRQERGGERTGDTGL